jgi:hypothetical protein
MSTNATHAPLARFGSGFSLILGLEAPSNERETASINFKDLPPISEKI